MATHRDKMRPLIAAVIAEHGTGPGIRKALREAYPLDSRNDHNYAIWLDEIRLQLYGQPKDDTSETVKRRGLPAAGKLFDKGESK